MAVYSFIASGKNHTDVSGADGRKPPSVRTPVGTKRLILTTRAGDFMADLVSSSRDKFAEVFRVERSSKRDIDGAGLPNNIHELPRYLRNAVAHFNVKPISQDGHSLTHLLVWNCLPRSDSKNAGKLTFVARVDVQKLTDLAKHILEKLKS